MMKPIAAATAAALLALGAAACSNGPLATHSSSAGASTAPAGQSCAGLSGTALQDCQNGLHSQTLGNNATGGAGGSAANGPGQPGSSGGASGSGGPSSTGGGR